MALLWALAARLPADAAVPHAALELELELVRVRVPLALVRALSLLWVTVVVAELLAEALGPADLVRREELACSAKVVLELLEWGLERA